MTVRIEERSYGRNPDTHRHDFSQLALPVAGTFRLVAAGCDEAVGEGRAVLVPSAMTHTYWSEEDNRFLVLDLPRRVVIAAGLEAADSLATPLLCPSADSRITSLTALVRAELAAGGAEEELVAEALGTYAASVVRRVRAWPPTPRTTPSQRLAHLARDYVDRRCTSNVTVGDVAEQLEVSESHLQRSFRETWGTSVAAYAIERRLERARELLATTRLTVLEVAVESGFGSHSYFCRVFRRRTGLTPSQFRGLT